MKKPDTDIVKETASEGEVEKTVTTGLSLPKLERDGENSLQCVQSGSSPSEPPEAPAPLGMPVGLSSDAQVPPRTKEDSTEGPTSESIVGPPVIAEEHVARGRFVAGEHDRQWLKDAVADFFKTRDLDAGEKALRGLSAEHQWRFINKVVLAAVLCEGLSNARLVGELVSSATSKGLCSPDSLARGFSRVMEVLDVVAANTPDASSRIAIMLRGAHLEKTRLVGLVEQAVGYEREMLVALLL